jgi:uncharacterized integral membrane protein
LLTNERSLLLKYKRSIIKVLFIIIFVVHIRHNSYKISYTLYILELPFPLKEKDETKSFVYNLVVRVPCKDLLERFLNLIVRNNLIVDTIKLAFPEPLFPDYFIRRQEINVLMIAYQSGIFLIRELNYMFNLVKMIFHLLPLREDSLVLHERIQFLAHGRCQFLPSVVSNLVLCVINTSFYLLIGDGFFIIVLLYNVKYIIINGTSTYLSYYLYYIEKNSIRPKVYDDTLPPS